MIACPFCGALNTEGSDLCDDCQHSLTDLNLRMPATAAERGLLKDRIESLDPKTPLAVGPNDAIGMVLKKMVAEAIGCVMVVDGDQLVGIFSERDALMRLNVDVESHADRPISTVMTPNPTTLRAKDKIAFALNRMDVGGFRHIPILENNKLAGVISIRDILAYLTAQDAGE